jgi:glycosyltransferase involved in cell wall biosynthesis
MTLRIAIIGSRGIPARYGGFETFAEEFSTRLAARGHIVYVSCEDGEDPRIPSFEGVQLFYFPVRPFYRIIYESLYDIYALTRASVLCDCVVMLGYGAGAFFFIPKLFGKKLITNLDGIEWRRDRYNLVEKAILFISEKLAVWFSDVAIADSRVIQEFIGKTTKKNPRFIPYGANVPASVGWDPALINTFLTGKNAAVTLDQFGYFLVVARMEPCNNIDMIVEGFLRANVQETLIVVGNFSNNGYKQAIDKLTEQYEKSSSVVFVGGLYDKDVLSMLRQNCMAYIHGHSAGGTNPSLLEAMACNALVIAHDNEFNKEVCANEALFFTDANDLATTIRSVVASREEYAEMTTNALQRVKDHYSWDMVVDNYEQLIVDLIGRVKDNE